MNWAHLSEYQPDINAAYAVSDGDMVGIGIWKNHRFTQVHLDDEDALDCEKIEKKRFVWWAHICVARFGVHPLDSDLAKMMQAEDSLIHAMRVLEEFGPKALRDDEP